MSERSIMFNSEMVLAVLSGRKTQTRRPVGRKDPFVIHCPLGQVGDRLRISEEVAVKAVANDRYSLRFKADGAYEERYGTPEMIEKIRSYRKGVLRGVHLPPAFSRQLRLEVVDVRVEQLGEISYDDCIAEGWNPACGQGPDYWFEEVWENAYGYTSIQNNPLVWVLEFRRIADEPAK